jgi:hypothetical protein
MPHFTYEESLIFYVRNVERLESCTAVQVLPETLQ